MDGIENARHDIFEATCSVETALDVLSSMQQDGFSRGSELRQVIEILVSLKSGLEDSYRRLVPLGSDNKVE